jgi:hypothetical protein
MTIKLKEDLSYTQEAMGVNEHGDIMTQFKIFLTYPNKEVHEISTIDLCTHTNQDPYDWFVESHPQFFDMPPKQQTVANNDPIVPPNNGVSIKDAGVDPTAQGVS